MAIFNTVYGGEPKWKPWVNTILYYDFEHTSWTAETDVAGNYNWTYLNTPTIWTLSSWKKYFNSWGTNYLYTTNTISNITYTSATVCVWINPQQASNGSWFWQDWRGHSWATIFCSTYNSQTSYYIGWYNWDWSSTSMTANAWNNVVIVWDGTTQYTYLNWTLIWTRTLKSDTANKKFYIWAIASWNGTVTNKWDAYFWAVIIENAVWSAQKIADYYDQTKANYS